MAGTLSTPHRQPLAAALAGAALGAALAGLGLWLALHKPAAAPPPPPALLALEDMGHLVSVKVRYANVIAFTQQITQGIPWTQWELRLGGTQVLLVARGDCLVGADMRQARYEAVDAAARTALLLLPRPATLSARVDHGPREQGGAYFYAVLGTGIAPLSPGSATPTRAIDTALLRAQQDVERTCQAASTVATAQQNAEAVLKPLFAATGWSVQVRWLP